MYYSYNKILTYEQPIKMVIGGRGIGKTYGKKYRLYLNKLKNPSVEYIWLYRYDIDITPEKIERWYSDLPFEMQETLSYKGRVIFIKIGEEKIPFIHFKALSKYGVNKGIPFPNVEEIIFDEFLVDEDSNYLPNEIFAFKQWVQSVFRTRVIKIFMLANALTIDNPYFSYFKIKRIPNQQFFKNKKVVVEYPPNLLYEKGVEKGTYADIFDDTETKEYDVEGNFYFDSDEFITNTKPKIHNEFAIINIKNKLYRIVRTKEFFWCTPIAYSNNTVYAITPQDVKEDIVFSQNLLKTLLKVYTNSRLWFSDLTTKNTIKEVLKC